MNRIAILLVVAAAFLVALSFRPRRKRVRVIPSPRFGILNLKGAASASLMNEDAAALSPVLGAPELRADDAPPCDVLFIYCDIDGDGSVRNSQAGLREIIRDSGASVVVVASENQVDAYSAASGNKNIGRANLVMTIDRNGRIFPNFFVRLFADMKKGVSMPVAWVKLAPQGPGIDHADCPDTIFACEAGQIAFK